MKKIIFIILVIPILIHAKLSDEQLKYYLEVSGELKLYKNISSKVKYFLDALLIKSGEYPAIDKLAKEVLSDPKLKDVYMDTFRDIPEDLYDDIIDFYKTDVGKKYASSSRWLFAYGNKRRTAEEIKLKYEKMIDKGLISATNYKIIENIANAYNEIELISDASKRLFLYSNKALGNKIDTNKLNSDLMQVEIYFQQIIVQLFSLQLIDFHNNDLEALHKYAKSNAGRLERKLMYESLTNWLIKLHKIAYSQQDKIYDMQFCYFAFKSIKTKPPMCEMEWLSKEAQQSIINHQNNIDNNITVK